MSEETRQKAETTLKEVEKSHRSRASRTQRRSDCRV